MTHAALQDLLPCPFCGEAGHSFESRMAAWSTPTYLAGCDPCNLAFVGDTPAEAIAAWNHRAALSAMEGEAAHGVKFATVRATDGEWLDIECRFADGQKYAAVQVAVEQDGLAHAIAAFLSAPPPQQAEKEDVGDIPDVGELTHERIEYLAGAVNAAWCKSDMMVRAKRCQQAAQALRMLAAKLHPTPSPGPQGGGEAEIRWVIGETVFGRPTGPDALAYADANWYEGSETDCRIPKLDRIRAVFATPPQPEAQVSDAMVKAVLNLQPLAESQNKGTRLWQMYSTDEEAEADVRAALTTSGRDG